MNGYSNLLILKAEFGRRLWCGIGIVSERIGRRLQGGQLWAFDISDRNIWYARETVKCPNVNFFAADLLEDKDRIRGRVTKPIDVISMVDVIEHIPKNEHSGLFDFLSSLTSDRAFIVLTYPSPQYQRHLMEHDPDGLQIIDQVIELGEVLGAASGAGFCLRHYSLETVWKQNQYVHCVLQTDCSIRQPDHAPSNLGEKLLRSAWTVWNEHVRYPFRPWWYVGRVFENDSHES